MKSFVPIASLLLCLCAAVVILWGGTKLGIREEQKRITPDRAPLKASAMELQKECRRLDRLYESHLRRIIDEGHLTDDKTLQEECQRLSGIRQVSLVHGKGKATWDRHRVIETDTPTSDPDPRKPYVTGARTGSGENGVPISASPLFDDPLSTSGWIDTPGTPLYYWSRLEKDRAVLFEIDAQEVANSLQGWVDENVRTSGTILGPGQSWERQPDFILPVSSRFASWELGAYDRFETVRTTNSGVIASAAVLASLLAGSGLVAFFLQRRALRLAEQRVSFVNQVSHELRTPLMNIQLNADLAADRASDRQPEVGRRVALVRDESRRLGRLIENVLTFSQSERGDLTLQERPVIPDEIVEDVLEQFAPALERRGIEIEIEGGVTEEWLLDADALAQILANLVSNVEKYAANGKLLRISLSESQGWLCVEVQDAGEGIDHRDRERIFKAFRRLENGSTEGASGTGLGLAIARDLAIKMGGTLEAQPSEEGALLALRVPIRKAA